MEVNRIEAERKEVSDKLRKYRCEKMIDDIKDEDYFNDIYIPNAVKDTVIKQLEAGRAFKKGYGTGFQYSRKMEFPLK